MATVYTGGFDAHTHLDFAVFDLDRAEVVAQARAAGVDGFTIAGSDHDGWDRTAAIARSIGAVAMFGVHPWETPALDEAALAPYLADLARRPADGIGEIGLDALHAKTDGARARQRGALRAQLAIARDRDLPVAFHGVRAWPELLRIVAHDGLPRAGGMVHAWSGPPELIARCVELDMYVSIGPLVLRDRARKTRGSVAAIPVDRLLLETDCPDMKPPGAARGEPFHLLLVAAEVAALRGVDPVDLVAQTGANARRLWRR